MPQPRRRRPDVPPTAFILYSDADGPACNWLRHPDQVAVTRQRLEHGAKGAFTALAHLPDELAKRHALKLTQTRGATGIAGTAVALAVARYHPPEPHQAAVLADMLRVYRHDAIVKNDLRGWHVAERALNAARNADYTTCGEHDVHWIMRSHVLIDWAYYAMVELGPARPLSVAFEELGDTLRRLDH